MESSLCCNANGERKRLTSNLLAAVLPRMRGGRRRARHPHTHTRTGASCTYYVVTACDVMPSGKHSIHLQAFHGNYWQRLPEIACQQYHQAAKDVVISPKILQCEVKCFK
ncbi:hypothetical protein EVAR_30643_1 [Eumeta japonica]|uniref:Uncharacterized protein n=1 Tax=Eumeta variegata TaxID=151549 RepID=A0A4C1VTR3_EUMVA|nr:hypothetical protein EVAR_30643_1 [Eumeta japonica]